MIYGNIPAYIDMVLLLTILILILDEIHGVINAPETVHFGRSVLLTGVTSDSDVVTNDLESGTSVHGCITRCKLTPSCSYVNYHYGARICFLIRANNTAFPVTVQRDGYVFGNKSEWDMSSYQACSICSNITVCNLSGATPTCDIAGCGPPPPMTNFQIAGNIYKVNSKLIYVNQELETQIIYACSENGSWYIQPVDDSPTTTTTTDSPNTTTTTEPSTTTTTDPTTTTTTDPTTTTTTDPTTTTTTDPTSTTTTPPAIGGFENTGWLYKPGSSKKYLIVTTPGTWLTAKDFCDRHTAGYLAVVYSSGEEDFIASIMPQSVTQYWAGATDVDTEGIWVWVLTSLQWSYTNFGQGQPGIDNSRNCLLIDSNSGIGWKSADCDLEYGFVCED